ncbi:TPA: transposase [Salmonella enterica]|uniref:Transposase n=3 Tax=Salmonella enterica TaxID=28901 RepID=A0A754EC94_SALER|nr:transposase [Salmonella enterica]
MDFKLELVEKSYLPGVCVAQLAREHGINDNLLFTWRQRYSHLLPDEIQRTINKPAPVLPVMVSDIPLPSCSEPHYEPGILPCHDTMVCEVTVRGASLRMYGDLSPAIVKTLIRELRGGRS